MPAKTKHSSKHKGKAISQSKRTSRAKACVTTDKRFVAKSGKTIARAQSSIAKSGISAGDSTKVEATRRANEHMLEAWKGLYEKRAG